MLQKSYVFLMHIQKKSPWWEATGSWKLLRWDSAVYWPKGLFYYLPASWPFPFLISIKKGTIIYPFSRIRIERLAYLGAHITCLAFRIKAFHTNVKQKKQHCLFFLFSAHRVGLRSTSRHFPPKIRKSATYKQREEEISLIFLFPASFPPIGP